MVEEGLIDEVTRLMNMGYGRELVSMQGIGYKEIIAYLEGETKLNEAIENLKRNTRRYAKRQLTWFRRDNRIKWIDINNYHSIEEICKTIISYIK